MTISIIVRLENKVNRQTQKHMKETKDLKGKLNYLSKENENLRKENVNLRCELIDMEEQIDILLAKQNKSTVKNIKELFDKSRRSKRGGASQYNLDLVKMMLEMISTGAAPSTIESLMIIFARTVDPDVEIEELPNGRYICNLAEDLICVHSQLANG